jgi:7,8-dihydropterin-6-yl-methyl-4-(beta-D-ribofuranosyl)aminobenzene 5'-phosphate synthase
MKLTALVENTAANRSLRPKHGLALYIETKKHRLLFDLGPDDTLFTNAAELGIDLKAVDTVIISHGHFDHGGALARFMRENTKAKIYVQQGAFAPHYTRAGLLKIPIGLDESLAADARIVTVEGDLRLDGELYLFTVPDQSRLRSPMNDVLLDRSGRDVFLHEQNLLITEDGGARALIMGCGHAGVANILEKARPFAPRTVVGGFHLYDPVLRRTAPRPLLEGIAEALCERDGVTFYTCHCTGKKAFSYLQAQNENVFYISAGDVLEI